MAEKQFKVAAIDDISGFGRCSLAVIIPVICAMGIQCVPVPTAVMSTHTGGFDDFVLEDMTSFIDPCRRHYRKLGITFDAIYTGFLASEPQVDGCLEFFLSFGSALRIVDPVMGDGGRRYRTYTGALISRMKELVKNADVITPNLTEAAMLLDEPYPETMTENETRKWLERLCHMSGSAVITGIPLENGLFSNMAFDGRGGSFSRCDWEPIPAAYPGTGDIFASVLTGKLIKGCTLSEASQAATHFSHRCVEVTFGSGEPERNGLEFERILSELL